MKKSTIFFLISFLMIAAFSNAQQTLNNPKDKAGYYIVKWDCGTSAFADTNDFEADETFTFAVDVTGTPWEDWLKETPTAAGATRALAFNKWTNWGAYRDATARLKQITGNIYGATYNLKQMATVEELVAKSVTIDSVVYVSGQIFGFEYTEESAGANWWMWPESLPGTPAVDPGTGSIFRTQPYTGTKTSVEFYSDEYVGGLFWSNGAPEIGFTVPCPEKIPTAIPDVIGTGAKVIGHEYYNMVGQRLPKEPSTGLYIDKVLKADGTSVVIKKFYLREQ
jgi:hypothetical protein